MWPIVIPVKDFYHSIIQFENCPLVGNYLPYGELSHLVDDTLRLVYFLAIRQIGIDYKTSLE